MNPDAKFKAIAVGAQKLPCDAIFISGHEYSLRFGKITEHVDIGDCPEIIFNHCDKYTSYVEYAQNNFARDTFVWIGDELPSSVKNSMKFLDFRCKDVHRIFNNICELRNSSDRADYENDLYRLLRTCRYAYFLRYTAIAYIVFSNFWTDRYFPLTSPRIIELLLRSKLFAEKWPKIYFQYINGILDKKSVLVFAQLLCNKGVYNQLSTEHKRTTVEFVQNISAVFSRYIPSDIVIRILEKHIFCFEYDG
jgi:hypothetical protein